MSLDLERYKLLSILVPLLRSLLLFFHGRIHLNEASDEILGVNLRELRAIVAQLSWQEEELVIWLSQILLYPVAYLMVGFITRRIFGEPVHDHRSSFCEFLCHRNHSLRLQLSSKFQLVGKVLQVFVKLLLCRHENKPGFDRQLPRCLVCSLNHALNLRGKNSLFKIFLVIINRFLHH